MAVAHFQADPAQMKLTGSYQIDKGTPLFARSQHGHLCRFRTGYPITLWPISVDYAGFETIDRYDFLDHSSDVAHVLRIRLRAAEGEMGRLGLKKLRFFLHGERTQVCRLYDLLFTGVARVALLPEGASQPVMLPDSSILPVGFGTDEDLLPYPGHAHPQYRLLQEYFTFPEKFLFVDIDNLDRHRASTSFDILILLNRMPSQGMNIDRDTFCTGCAPIINLFEKTTEPIRLTHRQSEYLLMPDMRHERFTEIHTIRSVVASGDGDEESRTVAPYFSYNHHETTHRRSFWHARRVHTERQGISGTELWLSLVDTDFNPVLPEAQTLFAHTLCTNRHIAGDLAYGTELQIEQSAPVVRITCLRKPTSQIDPPQAGSHYWRLISHLSLNYLSLSGGSESLRALREIALLHAPPDDQSAQHQINGIRGMNCNQVVRRIGNDAWRGFCRGTEITLSFDETAYVGSSPVLFASVLNQFFALYTSINSFTQLVATSVQREGVWKQWSPMIGEQNVL
jgi:type VI secretion system protein ImpG